MASSKVVTFERVVAGQRVPFYETTIPPEAKLVELAEDDHVHVVFGTDEELDGVGLAATKKPKKKVAAKKVAAKRVSTPPAKK